MLFLIESMFFPTVFFHIANFEFADVNMKVLYYFFRSKISFPKVLRKSFKFADVTPCYYALISWQTAVMEAKHFSTGTNYPLSSEWR